MDLNPGIMFIQPSIWFSSDIEPVVNKLYKEYSFNNSHFTKSGFQQTCSQIKSLHSYTLDIKTDCVTMKQPHKRMEHHNAFAEQDQSPNMTNQMNDYLINIKDAVPCTCN